MTESASTESVSTESVSTDAQLLRDTWFSRDLPVLRAVARLVDDPEHGGAPYLGAVVPASGLSKPQVAAAAAALRTAGLVEVLTNYADEVVRFTAVSAQARRIVGLWPTPQTEWARLAEQVTTRSENAVTDVERGRWRTLAAAIAGLGPDDGPLLMAAVIGGYVPRTR